jgi:toxin CcdB
MAQYDVHRNRGRSVGNRPYLVVVQSGLLHRWNRRVVVPLARTDAYEPALDLNPWVTVAGDRCRLLAHEIGNVPTSVLGELVANLDTESDRIVAALDLVLSRGYPVA